MKRSPTPFPSAARQRGQALTEFLVLAFALVPLFLLMPLVAKYQDIAHSTQLAARYAAFAAMARNEAGGGFTPEAELADEVRRRFFGHSQAPIKSRDVAGDFDAHRNLFWRRPDGAPLIPSFDAVALGFGNGGGAAHAQGFAGASDGSAFPMHGRFSLPARGIYTASVSVRLADLPRGLKAYEPFDRIGLVMTRSTSLALDPWTGRDPSEVQARLEDPLVFPGSVLREASSLVDPVVELAELWGSVEAPKLGQLDFWRDVVPPDRLRPQP